MIKEDYMNPKDNLEPEVGAYFTIFITSVIFIWFMTLINQSLVKSILKVDLYALYDQKVFNYILNYRISSRRYVRVVGLLNFGFFELLLLFMVGVEVVTRFKRKHEDYDDAVKYGYIISLLTMLGIDFIFFYTRDMGVRGDKILSSIEAGKEKIMEFLILYEDLYNNDLEGYLNRAMNSIYFSRAFIIFLLSILFFIIPLKIDQYKEKNKEQENQE